MRALGLEPTNHWTEESKEKLNQALNQFFAEQRAKKAQ
jgi:hypothetical protein